MIDHIFPRFLTLASPLSSHLLKWCPVEERRGRCPPQLFSLTRGHPGGTSSRFLSWDPLRSRYCGGRQMQSRTLTGGEQYGNCQRANPGTARRRVLSLCYGYGRPDWMLPLLLYHDRRMRRTRPWKSSTSVFWSWSFFSPCFTSCI